MELIPAYVRELTDEQAKNLDHHFEMMKDHGKFAISEENYTGDDVDESKLMKDKKEGEEEIVDEEMEMGE